MVGSMGFSRVSTPSIPTVLDEIFAEALRNTPIPTTLTGQKSTDGSTYTLAIEIPRLIRDTISVEIEENLKSTSQFKRVEYPSYKIVIKAAQNLLINYSDETQESAKNRYEEECALEGQIVALDGSLNLSYSEGVLVIEIPLCKPVQAKKASLSARLSDIES